MKKISLKISLAIIIAFFSLHFASAQTTQNTCLNLKYNLKYKSNDKNTKGEVTKLQDFLAVRAYFVGVTSNGNYGPATVKAVKEFQRFNNLITTGAISKVTKDKINEISCGIKTNEEKVIYSADDFGRSQPLINSAPKFVTLKVARDDVRGGFVIESEDVYNFFTAYKKENYDYNKLYIKTFLNKKDLRFVPYFTNQNSRNSNLNSEKFIRMTEMLGSEKYIQKVGKTIYISDLFFTDYVLGDKFDKYEEFGLVEGDKIRIAFSFYNIKHISDSDELPYIGYSDLTLKSKNSYLKEFIEFEKAFK